MFPDNDPRVSRRSLFLAGAGGLALAGLHLPAEAASPRRSSLVRYRATGFPGSHAGTAATTAGLVFSRATSSQAYTDPITRRSLSMQRAAWNGPVQTTGFGATQLIPSWNAATPVGTAVRVQLRARNNKGTWSRWFTVALWTSSSANATTPTRMTYNGQSDAVATMATDTLKATSGTVFTAWQLRLELLRHSSTTARPTVSQAAVAASSTPQSSTPVSPVGVARGFGLAVPAYSQMLHVGHYPAWNGGGEAWCSATSVAMVLDYWKKGASAAETAWVRPTPHTNPQVEQVVRGVWDAGYKGTGNWPFNVACAHARGLSGFVTRLRSLTEAELFIKAGIPLVVSTSFSSSQLSGAGFGTNGHLMVIKGFDASGNVRVNDPASSLKASNALVPRTYNRAQFESAWGRSGGLAYVIHPATKALPARPVGAAW